VPITGSIDWIEVITSVQRRRRWTAEEKVAVLREVYAPGMSVCKPPLRTVFPASELTAVVSTSAGNGGCTSARTVQRRELR